MNPAKPLNPVAAAAIFGSLALVVLAMVAVSGLANLKVWVQTASGYDQYIFGTIGVSAEIWGAFGLVVLVRRLHQKVWLAGTLALLLWLPAIMFNGYSTYRYFTGEAAEGQGAAAEIRLTAEQIEKQISEATSEIDAIGVTRTVEAIDAELNGLPRDYRTKRRQLEAERATAEHRQTLVNSRAQLRTQQRDGIAGTYQTGKRSINDTVLLAIVVWMEAVKAFGMFIIVARGKQPQQIAKKASDAQQATSSKAKGDVVQMPQRPPEPTPRNGQAVVTNTRGEKKVVRAL